MDEENKSITHTSDKEINEQQSELNGDAAREEAKNVHGDETSLEEKLLADSNKKNIAVTQFYLYNKK